MPCITQSNRESFPLIIGGHYDVPAHSSYFVKRPEGRNDWLLFFSLAGTGRIASSGPSFRLEPNQLALFPPGSPQDYCAFPGEPWNFLWVHFFPPPAWKPLLDWSSDGRTPGAMRILSLSTLFPSAVRRVRVSLLEAVRHAAKDSSLGDSMAMNLLERILLYCHQALLSGRTEAESPFVRDVHAYIAGTLNRTVRLSELAERFHLSPSRFSHRFRELFGMPPLVYVEQCRLEHAKRLLAAGICNSVKEVAYATGFADPAYFSKRFCRRYGISPRTVFGREPS